jgi:hypothetical protein
MESTNIRPFPLVQNTNASHKDISYILDDMSSLKHTTFDVPFTGVLVPTRFYTFVPETHEAPHIVLVGDFLPVVEDLRSADIELAPCHLRLVAELIGVGWYV